MLVLDTFLKQVFQCNHRFLGSWVTQ